MLALAKKRNLPTFLLTIVKHKTEKGGDAVAQFFLTEDQARVITANINSKDSFIVFGDGSFYPKRGASLERMTPSQIRRKYFADTPDELEQQHNAEIAQEAAITQWISKNKKSFFKMVEEADKVCKKNFGSKPFFKAISSKAKSGFAVGMARRQVAKILK